MRFSITLTLLALFIFACQPATDESNTTKEEATEKVIKANTDEQSLALAQKVMEAMGGEEIWNNTRHLKWNFFGSRKLWWDKYTGNVRIENLRDSSIFLYNLNTKVGQVKMKDEIFTEADTLKTLLKRAESIWINDSYWLVMPFKLLDEGVNLKYIGKDSTMDGTIATEVVELTFDSVGNTPNNKYLVHIDPKTNFVCEWEYYTNNSDTEPRITTPWADYKSYDGLMLSGNRGRRELSEIAVYKTLPESVYNSFERGD